MKSDELAPWPGHDAGWETMVVEQLEGQLVRAKAFVADNVQQPRRVAAHCGSLLTLMDRARVFPSLQDPVLGLIAELDGWPTRWGFWSRWEALLRFGIQATVSHPDSEMYLHCLDELGNLLLSTGRTEQALDTEKQAFQQALAAERLDLAMHIVRLIVFILVRQGRLDDIDAFLHDISMRLQGGDAAAEIQALFSFNRARVLRRRGQLAEAFKEADLSVTLLKKTRVEDSHLVPDAYNMRGVMAWACGEYRPAERDLRRAIAVYSATCDQYAQARVLGTLGLLYWSLGKLSRAEVSIKRSIEMMEASGSQWQNTMNWGNLGLVYLSRGELSRARTYMEHQLSLAVKNNDTQEVMRARSNLSAVLLHEGRFQEAIAGLVADETFQEQGGNAQPEGLICDYVWHVRCLAGLGREAAALALAQRTLAIARVSGSISLKIAALRCLAELLPPGEQKPLLVEALQFSKESGRKLDQAACLLSLALTEQGERRDTRWREGRRLLASIGASAWLRGKTYDDPPFILIIV
ncbi:MAG TPA: tetratricopeptide repeat protein [Anaerolineae bacterium]